MTLEEFALDYARQIRRAATSVVLKEAQGAREVVIETIESVLQKAATLSYSDSGKGLSPEERERLLALIDEYLGVASGTLRQLKEGSVRGLLDRQHSVLQAVDRIRQAAAQQGKP